MIILFNKINKILIIISFLIMKNINLTKKIKKPKNRDKENQKIKIICMNFILKIAI